MSAALLGLVASGACASAQAKAPIERPNLEVPPPPPRVIEPAVQEMAPPEPVNELPPQPVAARPRPQPPAREPRPDPKPEPPVEAPPQAAVPAGPPTPAAPAPILLTLGSADTAVASRQVRDMLERGRKALDAIDYRRLTKDGRTQYDSAKLMMKQAEEALKGSSFEQARSLADKAERMVKELQVR